ncbi:hypothetical protein GQ457_06G014280 [Hibiscus cannabinus]
MIQTTWVSTSGTVLDKFSAIGKNLKSWQEKRRAQFVGRIRFLRLLDKSLQRPPSRIPNCRLVNAKLELERLLLANEIYWAQCSHIQWLANGDKNTHFFLARATARRKKNTIPGLYNDDNVWKEGIAYVLNIAVAYFSGLFTSSSSFENPEILNHILSTVTSDMNASLLQPFTADEVVTTFQDIGHGKAPGIDGFPSSFFRLHWNIIGSDFTQLCLDLLHGYADMASINHTISVLIPKVASPDYMRQFRPISLCTVIYKTVSKVLVNRMEAILPRCISPTQGAFVSGRSTTDNILIAHELIHSLSSIGTGPFHGVVALSALLIAEQYSGGLVGLCASRNGPRINHLLFADDSLIFLRNSTNEALRLKHVLHIDGQASGQRVIYDKSAIFFCPKIFQQDRVAISATLGVHEESWGGNIPVHLYGDYEDDSELPIRCRHFMIPNCPLWDVHKIRAYFSSDNALSILQTPIQGNHIDTLIWYRHDSGIYSVRSGYSFLQRPPAPLNRPSGFWKMLAKLPILPKIRTFGWRATHDALLTGDCLRKVNLGDGFCPFCPTALETPLHALRDCPGAMEALRLAGFTESNFGPSSNSVFG